MRYTIWGPVVGIAAAAVLFLLGIFGDNTNLALIIGVALILIGLVAGMIMDKKQ